MKKEFPLISVIMPILNREEYLAEAIDSVLGQTYEHWELLLVDDGSTDTSVQIAEHYAAQHPSRIRCAHHPNRQNLGISASRNLGYQLAQGLLIACLDSDDTWVPDRLESQWRILLQFPAAGLVVGSTCIWHPGSPELDHTTHPGGPLDCLTAPPSLFSSMYPIGVGRAPSMNTVLVRSELIAQVGGWENQFRTAYEDQALLCKIYLKAPAFLSSKVLDNYRQHGNSVMKTEMAGHLYSAQRRQFLEWLDAWLERNAADQVAQRKLVQKALRQPPLWRKERPIQYALWRIGRELRTMLRLDK